MKTKSYNICLQRTAAFLVLVAAIACSSGSEGEETPAPDAQAPSKPTGLVAEEVTQNSLYLYWEAATDNVKVKNYSLYLNGEFLVGSGKTSYALSNLEPGKMYSFQIQANDAAGNSSELSEPLMVSTLDKLEAELQFDSGNIETYLRGFVDNVAGFLGNNYKVPTENDMKQWELIIDALLDDNIPEAVEQAVYVNYQIVEFTDTFSSPNQVFYVLKEFSIRTNYWGTFVFSKTPKRENLVLAAPHVIHDQNTGYQAAYIFRQNVPKALFISGAHRCNREEPAPCSGTTSACSTNSQAYRISDVPHSVNSMFQKTTEMMFDALPNSVFVQLHGFDKEASDPSLIISNGTNKTPQTDYVAMLRDALLQEDNSLTFRIPHINVNWTRYAAFDNTQGRYINGSPNPCSVDATNTTGRFIHIEQERAKLRANETGWAKVSNALEKVF